VCLFLISLIRTTWPAHLIAHDTITIFGEVYKL
jgi:hypothetical protein